MYTIYWYIVVLNGVVRVKWKDGYKEQGNMSSLSFDTFTVLSSVEWRCLVSFVAAEYLHKIK